MERVTLQIETIHELNRRKASKFNPKYTELSFSTVDTNIWNIHVPEWPSVIQGMKVTAFLENSGDWQSFVGWVNHDTFEIVSPNYRKTLQKSVFFFSTSIIALYIFRNQSVAFYIISVCCFFIISLDLRKFLKQKEQHSEMLLFSETLVH